MYEAFYGLRERPFDLTANPRFLFLTSGHREALSNLHYGITSHKGITLLVGEAGTGKTTLIRAALEMQRRAPSTIVYLSNPTLTRAEFIEFLASGFGLGDEAAASKVRFLDALEARLLASAREGRASALVIDEAQSLPFELLEEVRLLSNIETPSAKLLPVVLAGQPELAERLNDVSLRQLKQRVALRCTLNPLDLRETAAYIAKRVRIAGGESGTIFTRDAVETIFRLSRGVPRTISVVCDNALVSGFALDRRPVGADIVTEVCRDFDFALAPVDDVAAPTNETRVAPRQEARVDRSESRATRPSAPAAERPETRRAPTPITPKPDASETTPGGVFSSFGRRRRFSFF